MIKEMKIVSDFENKLLKRKELIFEIDFEGATPSRKEVSEFVSKKFNIDKDKIAVIKINTLSSILARAYINIYEDAELAEKLDKENIMKESKEEAEKEEKTEKAEEEKQEKLEEESKETIKEEKEN